MKKVKVSTIQMSCSKNKNENINKVERLIREAKKDGAQIILIQELFETLYFCQIEDIQYYKNAIEVENNKTIEYFSKIAKELEIVIPVSFYEKRNNARYNSVAVIDADGKILGIYRKTHIPDGPGYEEKFYFNPGDTGFKVWKTKYANIGIGICWDQWFPESARCMTLMGAEIILYPTAIGSEPDDKDIDSKEHWQNCMKGHSAANIIPIIVSNRVGKEFIRNSEINFYGSSFITNHKGQIIEEADRKSDCFLSSEFDLDEINDYRCSWGIFRDRRPEMYKAIMTSDGIINNIDF
ncbi:MAG: N-carbamoylputrescine amidase [Clostridiales bacterium]